MPIRIAPSFIPPIWQRPVGTTIGFLPRKYGPPYFYGRFWEWYNQRTVFATGHHHLHIYRWAPGSERWRLYHFQRYTVLGLASDYGPYPQRYQWKGFYRKCQLYPRGIF